jgi:hypothetical protein
MRAPGNLEIFYKKSTDGGINWITKRLTYKGGSSGVPDIAIDYSEQIHVVWPEKLYNYEIHYKKGIQ